MADTDTIRPSKHPKGWRLRRGGRDWYFPKDTPPDRLLAASAAIDQFWERVRQYHLKWTDATIRECTLLRNQILERGVQTQVTLPPTAAPTMAAPVPLPTTGASLTLHGAIARFKEYQKMRVPAEITQQTQIQSRHRCNAIIAHVTDLPLQQIDINWIRSTVQHFTQRPKTRDGTNMSPDYVRNIVAELRLLLTWCDEQGYWPMPGRFPRLFKVKMKNIMTDAELADLGNFMTYSLDDMIKLFKTANLQMRGMLLLGLTMGFANSEISTLVISEYKRHEAIPVIRRIRRKTGIKGVWKVLPEVKVALDALVAGRGENEYVFGDGRTPLVQIGNSRNDQISKKWRVLCRLAGVECKGFKIWRKQSSQLVRDIGGKDCSEFFLSHSLHDSSTPYTVQNPELVFKVMDAYYAQLAPFFAAIQPYLPRVSVSKAA